MPLAIKVVNASHGMDVLLFICPLSGCWAFCCFHFEAIISNVATNKLPSTNMALCGHMFSLLLGKYLGIDLLGKKVSVCLFFKKFCQTAFQSSCIIMHSHQKYLRISLDPYSHRHIRVLYRKMTFTLAYTFKVHIIFFICKLVYIYVYVYAHTYHYCFISSYE